MISDFTYHSDPIRIVFGAGGAACRNRVSQSRGSSSCVRRTRADFARRVTAPVADRCVGFCHTAGQHMPHEAFEHIIGDEMNWNAVEFKS
jgi:hypothetical protein